MKIILNFFLALMINALAISTFATLEVVQNSSGFQITEVFRPAVVYSNGNPLAVRTFDISGFGGESSSSQGVQAASAKPSLNQPALVYPNPMSMNTGATLGYLLSSAAEIELKIYDMFGYEIAQHVFPANTQGGFGGPVGTTYNTITIDRSLFGGQTPPSGIYFIFLLNNGEVIGKTKFAVRADR